MPQSQRSRAKTSPVELEHVTIDSMILANHAEAVNGLLYLSGGGWTDHRRQIQPGGQAPITHLGIGLCIFIPWHETNKNHPITLRIENDDANEVFMNVEMGVNVGRPPNLPPGTRQPLMMGMNVDTIFPKPGGYRIVAEVNETGQRKTWPFNVKDVPATTTLIQSKG